MFQINTLGALRVTQALLAQMRARGRGRLLYVSSIVGRVAVPGKSAYAASKWALEVLAESIALEAGKFNIVVSLLEPGRISTTGPSSAPSYLDPDGPYAPPRTSSIAPVIDDAIHAAEVASVIADTLESPHPPLRIPVGAAAIARLGVRSAPSAS